MKPLIEVPPEFLHQAMAAVIWLAVAVPVILVLKAVICSLAEDCRRKP